MGYTCTCTCENCALIREGNARDQQTSWLQRNSGPWNLIKLTVLVIFFLLITICSSPLIILAGGTYSCMLGNGITPGLFIYGDLWIWFIWFFALKFFKKWCPTCSSRCQMDNTKALAGRIFRRLCDRNTGVTTHPWNLDLEATLLLPPPLSPPSADQPCDICDGEIVQGDLRIWEYRRFERCGHGFHPRCLIHRLARHDTCPVCAFNYGRPQSDEGGSPPPPLLLPQRVDQRCTLCIRITELVQGDLDVWEYRRFERCGHGYHSSCLTIKLVEHDTCPLCTFDNRHLVGKPRGHEGTRIPEDV